MPNVSKFVLVAPRALLWKKWWNRTSLIRFSDRMTLIMWRQAFMRTKQSGNSPTSATKPARNDFSWEHGSIAWKVFSGTCAPLADDAGAAITSLPFSTTQKKSLNCSLKHEQPIKASRMANGRQDLRQIQNPAIHVQITPNHGRIAIRFVVIFRVVTRLPKLEYFKKHSLDLYKLLGSPTSFHIWL